MNLLPPVSVFVDESNSPLFRPSRCEKNHPYVVSAVAIVFEDKPEVLRILPRGTRGAFLKSSSEEFCDAIGETFLVGLFRLRVSIALVGVDATEPENCSIADVLVDRANQHRQKKLSKSNLMYLRTVTQALVNIWQCSPFTGGELTFFDLTLDSNSLPDQERALFEEILRERFRDRGCRLSSIAWMTDQNEPLLCAADIVAGVGKRWSSHQDVPMSWQQLSKGESRGMVRIQNGFEVYNAG